MTEILLNVVLDTITLTLNIVDIYILYMYHFQKFTLIFLYFIFWFYLVLYGDNYFSALIFLQC